MSFTATVNSAVRIAGSPWAFAGSVISTLLWLIVGPFYDFSDTWQLFANTATTIITFWMVFVIQAAQNRDGAAIQAKLDELIRASNARNEFIGIDRTSQEEVERLRDERA
jgi:low affinity Fe/Cu permease